MINVKIRGPAVLQGIVSTMQQEYPFGRRALWIGRGEEIVQKQNEQNYVLNVGELSKSVSRVHACLVMSPAFWFGYQFSFPPYFKKLGPKISQLPEHVLFQIWQFVRPARKIVLKDTHSKTGVFRKVKREFLSTGLQIVLGDSRPLIFSHQEIYDSWQEMKLRVDCLKAQNYIILNDGGHSTLGKVRSFWTMSFKTQKYILLDYPSRLTIGRSSNNTLTICEASISRRHAILEYIQGRWQITDGDGNNASSNGVWERVKKLQIGYRSKEKEEEEGESVVKLGDVLFTFEIKEDYSQLNVSQLCLSHKNSTNESFTSLMKKELEQSSPIFSKKSSHF